MNVKNISNAIMCLIIVMWHKIANMHTCRYGTGELSIIGPYNPERLFTM